MYRGLPATKPSLIILWVILTLSMVVPSIYPVSAQEKSSVSPNNLVSTCPNSDFSEGNFSNWTGCYGEFSTPCDVVGFSSTRHVIMPRENQTYDPFIGEPLTTLFPGEVYSARLGDTLEGNHSEQLRYTVSVTPDHFLFIYRWAAVLESIDHDPSQMPKFSIQVEDMTGNAIGGPCGFYEFTAPNCGPPGPNCIVPEEWHYFQVANPQIDLYWHDWTTIALDLSPFAGLGEVQIVFTTRGCDLQIHRGYAYLSTYCSPLAIQIGMCAGSPQATLTAPPGFTTYAWRGPGLAGPPIGTTQSVIISNPQPNDIYYVNLTAANGCMVTDLSQEIRATMVSTEFNVTPHCAGEATTFLDVSTTNQNSVVYWHWIFGDGGPDLGGIPNPTHVYAVPGTYTVTLNAYSTEGCLGSVSHTITIPAMSPATLTGPVTTCANGPGLEYTTEPGMTGYDWTFPPGTNLISGGTFSDNTALLSWNNSGNYTIMVNYTNPQGACTAVSPAAVTVAVGELAPPEITGENRVCLGATGQTYTTQEGKILYDWTIPPEAHLEAGGTGTSNFATVTWLFPGSYTLGVNYSEPVTLCSSITPAFMDITVDPWPDPAGNILGSTSVCKNTTENYSVPSISYAASCQWQYSGTGIIITNTGNFTVSITFTSVATDGILTVQGMNSCGNGPASPPFVIVVHDIPAVTFVPCFDLVTTPNARKIILRGGTPYYQGQGVFSGNRVSLNPASGFFEFNPQGAVPGNYPVTYSYTNTDGCTAAAAPVNITVQNNPFNCGEVLTDVRDGKKYQTVFLSGHCWMKDNLGYGMHIISPGLVQTDNCRPEKYCSPADAACTHYGGLYQWDEIMNYESTPSAKGICPPEWHVPSETEWQTLIDNLVAGTPLLRTNSTMGVTLKDTLISQGFQALTKGLEYNDSYWAFFSGVVTGTMFWTSTECSTTQAVARSLNLINPSIAWYCNSRANAFSQRCVMDN